MSTLSITPAVKKLFSAITLPIESRLTWEKYERIRNEDIKHVFCRTTVSYQSVVDTYTKAFERLKLNARSGHSLTEIHDKAIKITASLLEYDQPYVKKCE